MKKLLLIAFIAISINGSAQWVLQNSGTVNNLQDVYFLNSNVGYLCDASGYTRKTTNGGANWNIIGASNLVYGPIWFTSVDTGYGAGNAQLLKTTDGGLTWNVSCSTHGGSINFISSNIGFFSSMNSTNDTTIIFKTINAGVSWSRISSFPTMGAPQKLQFINSTIGFLVVDQDGIYKTIDGGITWIPKLIPDQFYSFQSVYFPSPNIGYLIGTYDSIYKSTDAGETWHAQINTNSSTFYSVFFTDDNHGYVVGGDGISQGAILKTVDGGTNWTLDLSLVQTLGVVFFPNANTGYTCGTNGTIYKIDLPTGINELSETNEINIYPNPATNEFQVTSSKFKVKSVNIYNVMGEEILPFDKLRMTPNESVTIDISSYAKGVYFVEVQTDGSAGSPQGSGVLRKKLIKE